MPRPIRTRRSLLLTLAVLLIGMALAIGLLRGGADPSRVRVVSVFDPYGVDPLKPYGAFHEAAATGDVVTLERLADDGDGYLAYRAALEVGRWRTIDAQTRLSYFRRALALRVDDPLARDESSALTVEIAEVAEEAGDAQAALGYYLEALPAQAAIDGVVRLEPDPYALANALLQARLYQRALDALGGRTAPSIEAPAMRALGRSQDALDAYQRWLVEQPGNREAGYGRAWMLYALGRLGDAEAAFRSLPGEAALYGRAIIANRRGDKGAAVALLERTHDADWLWLATGLLEADERYREAIPVYLRLARGSSAYADDAAYRAHVLAARLGDDATAAQAAALVPDGSFFALKLGRPLDVPAAPAADATAGSVPDVTEASLDDLPAVRLARALWAVHDEASAVGELSIALRDARRAAGAGTPGTGASAGSGAAQRTGGAESARGRRETVVGLSEMLQSMGEYRLSVQAARELISTGDRTLRVWRLAYPAAYPSTVEAASTSAGVPPDLVWAVMRQESAFSPVAVSRSNAMGLMQVVPSTWDWLAELQGDAPPGDPFDPHVNIRYGTYYLGWLVRYFDGDTELAISSYNRGQGYIRRLFQSSYVRGDKNELYREIDALETREYLQKVAVNLATYRALYPDLRRSAAP